MNEQALEAPDNGGMIGVSLLMSLRDHARLKAAARAERRTLRQEILHRALQSLTEESK
jgi:hypothetical protein